MKNVTITLDEKTAAWARVYAAKQNKSLSRLMGELLNQTMLQAKEYDEAMHRYLARKPVRLNKGGVSYPSREELHDRPGLR